jgi:phenylpropionate dioxygenase-like ring-hydroxylating dioxygenase large terminal subunit
MTTLLDDQSVVQKILDHIDRETTDLGERVWREPVANYLSGERFAAEMELLRRYSVPLCPSAALPESGSYVGREAAGAPIVAVRGSDGVVRAFRNACRHRGMQIADKSGCAKAFVCRYHGWTYGLDGRLRHVPHEDGFPGLEWEARGLAPLIASERQGLVFVTQGERSVPDANLDGLAPIVPSSHKLRRTTEIEVPANWKIFAEGFLEGYHIRPLHRDTFYPVQFDNLNVVESFGRNSRIVFPYRRINKLREVPAAERTAEGFLTYVYHLFPNVMVATFPTNIAIVILEPLAIDRTLVITYTVTDKPFDQSEAEAEVKRGEDFVNLGAIEDREVACAIQRGLKSGANKFFEFGRFEMAAGHFHRSLDAALAEIGFVEQRAELSA